PPSTTPPAPTSAPFPYTTLFRSVASLAPGRGRTVEVRGRRFSVWNVDGEFHAIDDACPHKGAPLGAGLLEGGRVYCSLHGWSFEDRKSTRLNSSHVKTSYAVFCL